jgi:hypothetical protein
MVPPMMYLLLDISHQLIHLIDRFLHHHRHHASVVLNNCRNCSHSAHFTWHGHHSSWGNVGLLLLNRLRKTLKEGLMSLGPRQIVAQRVRIEKRLLLISSKLVLGAKTYLGGCSC